MVEVKRTERGWAGHFISASECLFRRNTLLETLNVGIVVSTVGCMVDSRGERQEIGLKRDYETMAFLVDMESEYKDADVSKQIFFDSQWSYKVKKGDKLPDVVANNMHEAVVKEITEKLEKGEI